MSFSHFWFQRFRRLAFHLLAGGGLLVLLLYPGVALAQMVTGSDMPGYAETFGLQTGQKATDYQVEEIAVATGGATMTNVLWPGDGVIMTLHFINRTSHPLHSEGHLEIIHYGTHGKTGDMWTPTVFHIGDTGRIPLTVDLPASGTEDVVVHPSIPAQYGGYALVTDLPGHGRAFAATLVRVMRPDPGRVQFPTYALDTTWPEFMNEGVYTLFQRLGIKGMRAGGSYTPTTDPRMEDGLKTMTRDLGWAEKHDVTVMLTLDNGSAPQPLGRPRPWLSPDGKMLDTKDDRAWLPQNDDDFQKWVKLVAGRFGWPKGPVNAMELWNEPWESISISGWGADIPRYRAIFTHMAKGIVEARREDGIKVLIGGLCSSTNARDKLFSDGTNHFLPWLDFISIHYQAMSADPSLVPEWMHRKSAYGPVRVWDTESWVANSDDRVAGVIASMRAMGQGRTAGIFDGNVYSSHNIHIGEKIYPVVQAWSPAAAVAAVQKFIGQRPFDRLLYPDGLPWIFVFRGRPEAPASLRADDGTVVIVGDLGQDYDRNRTLFREPEAQLAPDAHMTLANGGGRVRLYDFYGNPVPSQGGKIVVPLNGLGYFLRSDGRAGSFNYLLRALETAHVEGYPPVQIVAHDLLQPVEDGATLHLTLTNILNRPVTGDLRVKLGDLTISPGQRHLELLPNQTRTIRLQVAGTPEPGNDYPLEATFQAGADGSATHREILHVNQIAHRTIQIDGDLSDWKGVLPEVLPQTGIGANITEQAWLPFKPFTANTPNGAGTVYLAYDQNNFYFAAKVADSTPDPGMVRFSMRDDDSYFYPDHVTDPDGKTLTWPAGVRHYSYRRNFDIPSGDSDHDNVLIAFNVLNQKPWYSHPPGTMPHFEVYWDTDYEFALNPVAAAYGGGTEVWRLLAPGMPRKSFFPREPHSRIDGGDVAGAHLVVRREGNMRIVEVAIPWSAVPEVHRHLLQGQTVKFTCRINDNHGNAHELAAGRSVSRVNSLTFHPEWQDHWSNELEFSFEH